MIERLGSEAWLERVDAVIRLYRSGGGSYNGRDYFGPMPLEDALEALRRLGLGEGVALRWLGKRTPPLPA